jgi:Raf kinase inhibitor-like YbhB/YbcL family protein
MGVRFAETLAVPNRPEAPAMNDTLSPTPPGRTYFLGLALLLALGGCKKEAPPAKIEVTSPAFQEGQTIPERYAGDKDNVSPPLAWGDVPPGTQSFALICEDPDAPDGTFSHWVLFNVPAKLRELREGASRAAPLPGDAAEGTNDAGTPGYFGPAPPPGKAHRYYFKLYALDRALSLPTGATRQQVLDAMKGHVLGEGHVMGLYGR